MEIFQILTCFFICFLVSLHTVADYTISDHYLINCGSPLNVSINGHNFTGDVNPTGSLPFKVPSSSRLSETVEDRNSSATNMLYRSARIFRKPSPSPYGFKIDGAGIYVVRFHFFYFANLGNLSNVRFNVLASGFTLLSNFTVGYRNFTHFPPVEEFLLRIPSNKLRIEFVPYSGFFAFVNAIEVFLAPDDLIPNSSINITRVTPEREEAEGYHDLQKNVLHVVHRINVGGENITPEDDILLRYWIPDDNVGFMMNNNASKKTVSGVQPTYTGGRATSDDAPDNVYRTAKEMNITRDGGLNVSWHFDARKRADHLVRVHFYDIVTQTKNEFVKFNLYIYSNFGEEIYPYGETHGSQAIPFYKDYVVKSDDSGYMNISIGPSPNTGNDTEAFLNGVEIMEIIGYSSRLDKGGIVSPRRAVLIIVVSSAGGVFLVLAIVFLAVFFLVPRRKKWIPLKDWALTPLHRGSSCSGTIVKPVRDSPLPGLNLGLKISLSEILYATNKFSSECKIGNGGFGKVYKGRLWNGKMVAVKRSEAGHGQGFSEFETEISILSKICFRHLVSLIGYCDEKREMILVYEFMEKGTLRDHLYTSGESTESASVPKLSWDLRLRICIAAAEGLHYLHTGPARPIIHRDIKSTNILLDENYVAKVADFGLSCSSSHDQSHVTTQVKGTFGYLDPEYFKFSQLTQKSDVYSFGVVLLEVLCARPAVDPSLPQGQVNLADWGLSCISEDQLGRIVDPFLAGKITPDCLRKFGETVEKCLRECGEDRPDMGGVLWDLKYCLKLQNSDTSTALCNEDSAMTDFGVGLSGAFAFQRWPSDTIGEDKLPQESGASSEAAQVDPGEVFSQLKFGDAR